jgi:putative outer membrane protein, probably involved in nutrient binding
MTYSFGNVLRLDPVFKSAYNDLSSMTKVFKNRWMRGGDELITNVPTIIDRYKYHKTSNVDRVYSAYNLSNVRVAKGDFIRMKEISLAYDFPKTWFSNTPINNLSVKLQATNLFLLYADSKLNGQDPEFFNTGGVASPMPKQFTLTVKVGL